MEKMYKIEFPFFEVIIDFLDSCAWCTSWSNWEDSEKREEKRRDETKKRRESKPKRRRTLREREKRQKIKGEKMTKPYQQYYSSKATYTIKTRFK
jgi:hypothetical protein